MSVNQEIELGHAGTILRRRWPSIVAGTLSVIFCVGLLTHFWPRTYQSEATILVEKSGRNVDAPALDVLERLGRGNSIATEIRLMQSRRVLDPVVDSLELHVSIETATGRRPAREVLTDLQASTEVIPGTYKLAFRRDSLWSIGKDSTGELLDQSPPGNKITAAGLTFTAPHDSSAAGLITIEPVFRAIRQLQRSIGATLLHRDAELILLTCEAASPSAAQRLCQLTAESYVQLRSDMQRSEATSTAAFLRTQVARIGQQLVVAEGQLQSFRTQAGVVVLHEQASAQVRDVFNLVAQREQIETERSALFELIADVDAKPGAEKRYQELASFPTLLKNAAVTSLLASLADLQNRRSDLGVLRMDRDPELAALDDRIDEIRQQLHTTATGYESALRTQVRSLDDALATRRTQMSSLPWKQTQAARLERQVNLLADLHHSLEMRLREAEVAEAVHLTSVEIADAASSPLSPAAPNVKLNMTLGLIIGVGFGLGLAMLQEARDTRIYEWRQLEQQTKVPVLSLIPPVGRFGPLLDVVSATEREIDGSAHSIVVPAVTRISGKKRSRIDNASIKAKRSAGNHKRSDEDMVAFEAFRSLASDLSFIARDIDSGVSCSIAVTSAGAGEGKTFTACNLALARAANGTRTLVIDCDMHVRGVSTFFDLPKQQAGLSDVLQGRATLLQACRQLHLNDSRTLSILPAGKASPDAGGLLEGKKFIDLVKELSQRYDLIVVDTPPLNILNDASAVAHAVDAVLVVVRKGVTDRRALELTLERLRRIGSPPIGLVFGNVALPEPYLRYSGSKST